MICKPCKMGGELNKEALGTAEPQVRVTHFHHAAACHEHCKGGTHCCCQHILGHVIASGKEAK